MTAESVPFTPAYACGGRDVLVVAAIRTLATRVRSFAFVLIGLSLGLIAGCGELEHGLCHDVSS
jgi:uncharacterized membrane protein